MVASIIHWSLRNRAAILALALILCLVGGYVALNMPVDVFPDLTFPTVTVMTEAHGMAPSEVETQITFPLEAAINGAPGVRKVRSATVAGFSIIWVEFEGGTDMYLARQIVTERIAAVEKELPQEVEKPILAPASSIMGEILFISLSSVKENGKEKHSLLDLHTLADTEIRRRLLSVPGVSQVTPTGGGEKQYQVVLSPEKLRIYDISLDQVVHALAASNKSVSPGFLNERGSEYIITATGRLRTLESIGDIVVIVKDRVLIRISDIGHVRIGEAPKRGEGSAQAKPAVIIGIQKQPGTNTIALTHELDKVIDELAEKLKKDGMLINRHVFRQADFIDVAYHNVLHALRDGGILVIVIVLFFLANIRATLITLTAIPLSLLAAVLTLKAFGSTINTMTLGGMAIAIGMLVDDAIIDVENVFRRLRENSRLAEGKRRSAFQVIFDASVEVRTSIVFATFIIALVFLPLFFLSGVEGRLLQPLGMAYLVSLMVSLVVAVTIVPALCYILLPKSKSVQRGTEPRVAHLLKEGFEKLLRFILRYPLGVALPAFLLFAAAVVGTQFMGHSFLPEFNEGALTISITTLPGTSLAESNSLANFAEEILLTHPEVRFTARRTGRAELSEHAMGVESSEIDVSIQLKKRTKEEFLKALRDDLSIVPGVSIIIGQPISHRIDHMLSGARANIAVKIFGEDLYKLRTLAEKTRQQMSTVSGVVDLSVEHQMDIPVLKVRFDRTAIAKYGLHIEDVAHILEAAFQGEPVSRVFEGRNSFDLVVRIEDEKGWDSESIGNLLLDTPMGTKIPLRTVAAIEKDYGPNVIHKEQAQRKIVVMCNVAGRDVISVVEDIQKLVNPVISEERGYRVEYGGQFESAINANRILTILGIAVVLTIGFLLHLAFGSFRDTLFVMLNLPLALIGGIVGVFASGGILSVASLIGFITVFGIATRNGIMLISHIRHLQEYEGVTDFREAVLRGAKERLVPILMTALAAGLALIPLALGGGKPGSEIQTPMAIVILFGLMSSMLLNMIVVPTLYLKFGRPTSPKKVEGGTVR